MRALKLELSHSSIRAAIDELAAIEADLAERCDRFCERLAGLGVDVATSVVREDTGELRSGIYAESGGPGSWLVVSAGAYAAFVEFGTGVVGQGTYPGKTPPGWGYDERRTPEAHNPADPTRWYYYDRDGNLGTTRGQTANAYMATAADAMRQQALDIAREVFEL